MPYDYEKLISKEEAAIIGMDHFGPNCELPNLILTGAPEHVPSVHKPIVHRFEKYNQALAILKAWENGTWMYLCGFRLKTESSTDRIICTDLRTVINMIGVTGINTLCNRLDALCLEMGEAYEEMIIDYEKLTPFERWQAVITHELTSSLERGLTGVFDDTHLTGSGSDDMDIEGRFLLFRHFGISDWNENRHKALVQKFSEVRHLQQHFL